MSKSRTRVLWIEDKTQLELAYLVPPVLLDGNYDLEVAHNATQAVEILAHAWRGEFDLLVFDLDIPPGKWLEFQQFYKEHERQGQEPSMLGLELLAFIRRGGGMRFKVPSHSPLGELLYLTHRKYNTRPAGVFSIYTDLKRKELIELLDLQKQPDIQKKILIQKHAGMPRTALLKLLNALASMRE